MEGAQQHSGSATKEGAIKPVAHILRMFEKGNDGFLKRWFSLWLSVVFLLPLLLPASPLLLRGIEDTEEMEAEVEVHQEHTTPTLSNQGGDPPDPSISSLPVVAWLPGPFGHVRGATVVVVALEPEVSVLSKLSALWRGGTSSRGPPYVT